MAADEIKLGVLATLIGPFSGMGEDGIRGVNLAVTEFGGEVAGRKITVIKESTNALPDSAEMMADMLLNQHKVDFIVGPLSGNEGLAIRDYATKHTDKAFINGTSAAQDMTLRDPAPNFFSFATNGVQWISGLAEYAYETLGYKRIATLAEDYSYPHGQVAGFTLQYCRIGGRIAERFWVPLGMTDYRMVIQNIPTDVDAIFVALAGTDAVHFLQQYGRSGRKTPLVAGTSTIDQTVLNVKDTLLDWLVGTVMCGPVAPNNPDPAWQTFLKTYRDKYPKALSSPSLFAWGYYVNTKAALLALRAVKGDLSNGQKPFMETLRKLEFDTPTGHVRLDRNQNAIGDMFINMVDRYTDGSLYSRLVKTIPRVDQTLGMTEADYLKIGPFNRDNPAPCP
jgi:branched-chain amino acid transport system substrate-binding protein